MLFTKVHFNNFIFKCTSTIISVTTASTKGKVIIIRPSIWYRFKYTQNKGVKGLKSRTSQFIQKINANSEDEKNEEDSEIDQLNLNDEEYDELASKAMNVTRNIYDGQKVFVIQPFIKWGKKKINTNPDLQLEEAEALIKSLPQWSVEFSLKVPLESLERKTLFGKGKLKEIKDIINECNSHGKSISCVFVSKGKLSFNQKSFLQNELNVPIMDRYSIVIQILRLHATSAEAKLQVAMAEIPYIWGQMKDINPSISNKKGYALNDSQRELLNQRENKIKNAIKKIRNHRKLLRNKRIKENYPIIAVVGYTNAGKTSLIKALTNEENLKPRNQLFATLDVTAHSGILPCRLQVIYMDTVGFISDLPTELIECFIATLEDAMLSDIIIHVQDVSHENYLEQRKHVENTLKLISSLTHDNSDEPKKLPVIINVGNKIDLVDSFESLNTNYCDNYNLVSSKTLLGINDLMLEIESNILQVTDRIKLVIRCSSGGAEMAWLYKNAVITNSQADPNDEQSILLNVIIHNSKLKIFKHHFVEK